MQHRIDWLSYTYDISDDRLEVAGHLLFPLLKENLPDYINADGITSMSVSKRRGFNASYAIGNHTYVHVNMQGLVLIEHTGKGCTLLSEEGLLLDLIKRHRERVTRIDIATDILTDTSVPMFIEKGQNARVKSKGYQLSKTGETYYYGSKKSDRVVTVYRYYKPHPRADWLRIEHRFKGKQAKTVADLFAEGLSIETVALRANNRMNWTHHCWRPDTTEIGEIQAWRPERAQNKRIRWFMAQVVPALVKSHIEGEFTIDELTTAFFDKLREVEGG